MKLIHRGLPRCRPALGCSTCECTRNSFRVVWSGRSAPSSMFCRTRKGYAAVRNVETTARPCSGLTCDAKSSCVVEVGRTGRNQPWFRARFLYNRLGDHRALVGCCCRSRDLPSRRHGAVVANQTRCEKPKMRWGDSDGHRAAVSPGRHLLKGFSSGS
jgi:hypothetical protein